MTIFDRYIFKEIFFIFALSLLVLTSVLFLEKINFLAELIFNKGVSFFNIIQLLVYLSPSFLSVTIPMAILFSSIMGFSRLSGESELIAMRACGLSIYRLIAPVVVLAILGYIIASVITVGFQHKGNLNLKNMMIKILRSRADIQFKEQVFFNGIENMSIFIKEKKSDSQIMKGVLIYEGINSPDPRIITASQGGFIPLDDSMKLGLHLVNGQIHHMKEDMESYQLLEFKEYDLKIDFNKKGETELTNAKGRREMSINELRDEIKTLKNENKDTRSLEVEIHTKFSLPFACIAFGLLGAPLGIRVNRSGRGGGFGVGILIMVLNYMLLIAGQSLGEKGYLSPALSIWLPNAIVLALAIYLLRKTAREITPFAISLWFSEKIRIYKNKLNVKKR